MNYLLCLHQEELVVEEIERERENIIIFPRLSKKLYSLYSCTQHTKISQDISGKELMKTHFSDATEQFTTESSL